MTQRFRWLARIPLLPHIFDALLLTTTALTNRPKLRAIESLEKRAVELFAAKLGLHRFGGVAFVLDGREIGHVHGNGLFDALVGRTSRDAAVAAGLALPHHIFPRFSWISFWIKGESDVDRALELLQLARDAGPARLVNASAGLMKSE